MRLSLFLLVGGLVINLVCASPLGATLEVGVDDGRAKSVAVQRETELRIDQDAIAPDIPMIKVLTIPPSAVFCRHPVLGIALPLGRCENLDSAETQHSFEY